MRPADRAARRAITLIELLVVMAIIMVLASLTIGVVSVLKTGAKNKAARSLLNGLSMALEQYQQDWGWYPPDGDVVGVINVAIPPAHPVNGGPFLWSDPFHGIKNMRVALSGAWTCPQCGYEYDPYVMAPSNDNQVILFPNLANLHRHWPCPNCDFEAFQRRSDDKLNEPEKYSQFDIRFVRGKNYLGWLKADQIGQGVLDIDLNHDGTIQASAWYGSTEQEVDMWGAILDPWGQPVIYYSLYDKPNVNPGAWSHRFPPSNQYDEMVLLVAGKYVLCSYGPK